MGRPETPKCIVYLVDDDLDMLKMLQALVDTIGLEARAFSSAEEFLAAYRATPCECLVCDLRMPRIDGMELQRRLAATGSALPIIFLTGFAEVQVAVEAIKRGAFDFLEKPFRAQDLLGKIQSALELCRLQYAKHSEDQSRMDRIALLTKREREVVHHVLGGKSSREISDLLGIGLPTVEKYRAQIMEKLDVQSTVDLIKLFL